MPRVYGRVLRTKPTSASVEYLQLQQRVSHLGDTYTIQLGDSHNALADEGSYFKATYGFTASAGTAPSFTSVTGVYTTTTSSFTPASPVFMMYNNSPVGGKRIFLDYIRIGVVSNSSSNSSVSTNTTGASTATGVQCVAWLDPTNAYRSGGLVSSPFNANVNNQLASNTSLWFGNGVTTLTLANSNRISASTSASYRTVFRHMFRSAASTNSSTVGIPTAGDMYTVDFGDHIASSTAFVSGTSKSVPASSGPVVIAGGSSFLFYLWYPGYGAVSNPVHMEYEIAWWER